MSLHDEVADIIIRGQFKKNSPTPQLDSYAHIPITKSMHHCNKKIALKNDYSVTLIEISPHAGMA
jgi:hypothetical protein